ncbi:MAG TPA: 3'(2'),5'-bisphosphate nucleotidase CysQ [Micropepsaceae bacterium]|nr:3'(2'),5'-bisphosphate nucleotidase CysQ [Micropepsaceae bacterium]
MLDADKQDAKLLEEAARAAGALILAHRGRPYRKWDKGGGAPVTEADLEADALLRQQLMGARPSYGWISEESADDSSRLAEAPVFIVDPLDGTAGFIRGKNDFTVSLAVARGGAPSAACIFNPTLDEMFIAVRGGGATLNGAAISVSAQATLSGCRMLGSRAMFEHPAWPERWPEMMLSNPSSIAYRMALVAAGRSDAMLALSSKNDWDIAAGHLLVSEAGGRASTHDGGELRYNLTDSVKPSIMCAGRRLYDLIHARVASIKLPRAGSQ